MANNNQPIRMYQKQFSQLLAAVYGVQGAFQPAFGNLQVLDGIQDNETAFSVKVNDVPVVVGEYSTDENTAFGKGTGNSSRFGNRQEVKYGNVDIPYDFGWAIHEGIDRHTVNNDLDAAVADRLDLQAQVKTRLFNQKEGEYLVANGEELKVDASDVKKLFETAAAEYVNREVVVPVRAYVSPEVYNAVIDLDQASTAKGSAVNVDENGMVSYRGFALKQTPDKYLAGAPVIFAPDNVGRAFTGISTARTIESEDFDGVALQGAGKAGEFISDDNLKAVLLPAGAKGEDPTPAP